MQDRYKDLSEHRARQDKADDKVRKQEEVLRKLNGNAVLDPEEQQLLNEMRGNKASLDFNRAMFDYDEEHKDEQPKKS